jgi:hypothetical protein
MVPPALPNLFTGPWRRIILGELLQSNLSQLGRAEESEVLYLQPLKVFLPPLAKQATTPKISEDPRKMTQVSDLGT